MSRTLKHYASPSFWKKYEKLPEEVKRLADKNFELLKKEGIVWFWIGKHSEYEKIIKSNKPLQRTR